jgi:hypothetical protein
VLEDISPERDDQDGQDGDLITAREIIESLGWTMYQKLLAHNRHHSGPDRKPVWTLEEAESLLGIIEFEERRRA